MPADEAAPDKPIDVAARAWVDSWQDDPKDNREFDGFFAELKKVSDAEDIYQRRQAMREAAVVALRRAEAEERYLTPSLKIINEVMEYEGEDCPICKGKGSFKKRGECKQCNGTGTMPREAVKRIHHCQVCDGTGSVKGHGLPECSRCEGTGMHA
jgi:hypothetical protein